MTSRGEATTDVMCLHEEEEYESSSMQKCMSVCVKPTYFTLAARIL
jgi:hypothetical protein